MSNEFAGAGIKRKRGRPRKEDSRRSRIEIRFGSEDTNRLEELSYLTEESSSEIIRKALKLYYYTEIHKH